MSFTLTRGINSVVLRNPSLGNKYTLDTGLVTRRSRGGKTLQYKDPNNLMITSESLTFTNIKKSIVDDLIVFLAAHRGKELTINTRSTDIPGFVQNETIDYVVDRETSCSAFYTFDLIVTYTYLPAVLAAEDLVALVTEADDYLTTEA